MVDEISLFPSGEVSPAAILKNLSKLDLDTVVVAAWKNRELVIASSTDRLPEIIFLLSHAQHWVMEQSHDD